MKSEKQCLFLASDDLSLQVDCETKHKYLYKHVLHDSLQVCRLIRIKYGHRLHQISIGVWQNGDNCSMFEHVAILFGALLANAQIVLLDRNLGKGWSSYGMLPFFHSIHPLDKLNILIKQFNLIIFSLNESQSLFDCNRLNASPYTISFQNPGPDDMKESRFLDDPNADGTHFVVNHFNRFKLDTLEQCSASIVVPVFRKNRLDDVLVITEYAILSQLVYGQWKH